MIKDMDKFHNSSRGKLTFGIIEFLIAYILISRAIDTGSVFQWVIGLILLVGAISNFGRAFKRSNVKTKASKS